MPLGFVVFSLATQFAHMSGATSELATPLSVVLALVGFGLSLAGGNLRRVDGWLVATGVAVYAVFAAPTVLTGRATFLGYIKLDDTATYLAMLDRAGHHGYDATGLGPSTYEALLESAYVIGYPLGAVLPLDTGRALVSEDLAWLWQPYVAFLALLIGLSLYQLVSEVVRSRPLRAVVAVVGSQAALVYGYSLWGGVKELFTAATVATLAALVPIALRQTRLRAVLPIAAASAAVLSALSLGGAVWLALPLAAATVLLVRQDGVRENGPYGTRIRRRDRSAPRARLVDRRRVAVALRRLHELRRVREPHPAAEPAAGLRHLAQRRLPDAAVRASARPTCSPRSSAWEPFLPSWPPGGSGPGAWPLRWARPGWRVSSTWKRARPGSPARRSPRPRRSCSPPV